MKKIQLYKAAIDFAFSAIDEKNAVTLAEKSIAAFKAGNFDPDDLLFWDQTVRHALQQFAQLRVQKLPSEVRPAPVLAPEPAPAQAS